MVSFNKNVITYETFGKFEYDRSCNTTVYSGVELNNIINQLRFYKKKVMVSHPKSINNLSLFNSKKCIEYRKMKLKECNC